jgi:hypothetical protein
MNAPTRWMLCKTILSLMHSEDDDATTDLSQSHVQIDRGITRLATCSTTFTKHNEQYQTKQDALRSGIFSQSQVGMFNLCV